MRVLLLAICLGLVAASVSAGTVPAPLALANAELGGGPLNQYTPGVADGIGLNNIGLLVKCWGTVTGIDTAEGKFFYIDDGSARLDTSGFQGVRVAISDLAPGNTIAMPTVGQFLVITGISSTSALGTAPNVRIVPTLRPRRQIDIQTLL